MNHATASGPNAIQIVVRCACERWAAPLDGDTEFAGFEQVVIVLGISDGNGVVKRQAQRSQRFAKTARLVDASREHHDPTAIEDKRVRQLDASN